MSKYSILHTEIFHLLINFQKKSPKKKKSQAYKTKYFIIRFLLLEEAPDKFFFFFHTYLLPLHKTISSQRSLELPAREVKP